MSLIVTFVHLLAFCDHMSSSIEITQPLVLSLLVASLSSLIGLGWGQKVNVEKVSVLFLSLIRFVFYPNPFTTAVHRIFRFVRSSRIFFPMQSGQPSFAMAKPSRSCSASHSQALKLICRGPMSGHCPFNSTLESVDILTRSGPYTSLKTIQLNF